METHALTTGQSVVVVRCSAVLPHTCWNANFSDLLKDRQRCRQGLYKIDQPTEQIVS